MIEACSVCKRAAGKGARELRPYGPGGALICFECGTAPERAQETERRLNEHLDRVCLAGDVVVIGPGHAPLPLKRPSGKPS